MSTTQRSIGCSPVVTHCASTQPAPPAEAMPKALKPAPTKKFLHLRRFAEDEVAVGREDLRPVDHLLDAGGRKRRDARERRFHVLLEMVPVVVEELELEILGHVAGRPGDRVRLVAAEDEAADLFLEIGAPVGIADGRERRRRRPSIFSVMTY